MADRSVSIALIAQVSGFVAGMKTAEASVSKLNASIAASAKKQQALRELGNAAGAMGAAAAIGVYAVVKAAANFESAMSRVAATGDDARQNLDALHDAAIAAGAATKFSATEAADGITELLKAGVSAKDVLAGGLTGALDLAAAGELDVADAAGIMATAMSQFSLPGTQATHVADLLAAAAGKAQGEVGDMAQALKYVGPVAAQMGVSIEETTGTIAELAHSGILADQAGTSLRGMLTALTSPSKIAADEMKKLGINVYDAQGNFVGFSGIAGQLQSHMKDLSNAERDEALGRIFGNQQITAARILYAGGAADVKKWTDAVNDNGFAAETAATKMDNLAGDLEQLRGSLETALITTGEGSQGPLREVVQLLTDLVNAYNQLPGPVKSGVVATFALTAAIGGTIFAASRAVIAYQNMGKNLETFGLKAEAVNKRMLLIRGGALAAGFGLQALDSAVGDSDHMLHGFLNTASLAATGFAVGGPWGAAIGGGIGLVQAFAGSHQEAAQDVAGLTATLDEQTGALTTNSREWAAKQVVDAGAVDAANMLGISAGDLTRALLDQGDAAGTLADQLEKIIDAGTRTASGGSGFVVSSDEADAAQKLLTLLENTNGTLEKSRAEWKFNKDSVDAAGGAAAGAAGPVTTLARGVADAAAATKRWTADLQHLSDVLSNRSSVRDYEAALDAARKASKSNADITKENTEAQRKAQAAFDDVAAKALAHKDAMDKAGKSTREQQKFLEGARDDLIDLAKKFNTGKQSAREYADAVLNIPKMVKTTAQLNVEQARSEALAYKNYIENLPVTMTIRQTIVETRLGVPHVASGGHIHGPGTGTSDSIPAWLSDGEFVVNAKATKRHLSLLHSINAQGFAEGGEVSDRRKAMDAFLRLLGNFDVGPRDSQSDVRSMVHELVQALKDAVGKDSPLVDHLKNVGDKLIDAAGKFDKASEKLDELHAQFRDISTSVASAFQHDLFGGSLQDAMLQARADVNDAREARQDLRAAGRRGLDPRIRRLVAQSGNTALIDDLAHASRREIAQFEHLFRTRNRVTTGLGREVARDELGPAIKHQNRVLDRLDGRIQHLERVLRHLPDDVAHGAHSGTKAGTEGRQRAAAALRKAG